MAWFTPLILIVRPFLADTTLVPSGTDIPCAELRAPETGRRIVALSRGCRIAEVEAVEVLEGIRLIYMSCIARVPSVSAPRPLRFQVQCYWLSRDVADAPMSLHLVREMGLDRLPKNAGLSKGSFRQRAYAA